MDRRAAKKVALGLCGTFLQVSVQDLVENHVMDPDDPLSEADGERLATAVLEIANELIRRSNA